jgi:hypothetical protein
MVLLMQLLRKIQKKDNWEKIGMKKLLNNIFYLVISVLFISFVIYVIITRRLYNKMEHDFNCTFGVFEGTYMAVKTGLHIDVGYYVKNKYYSASILKQKEWKYQVSKRYWVKYLPSNPSISQMVLDKEGMLIPVTDSLQIPKECDCGQSK